VAEDKCAQCGTPAAPGAKFCESCGAPLAAPLQPAEVQRAEKCAQCGTPAAPGAKFCESCGAALVAVTEPVQAPAAVTEPVQAPAAAEPAAHAAQQARARYPTPGTEMPYQGVAIRFVAILIDGIIVGIISTILTSPLWLSVVNFTTGTATLGAAYYAAELIGAIISLLYFILLLGHYGQTAGMMIVKIKVVKEADYLPISYGEAAIRTILLLIDAIPYVIPYLLGAILIWTSGKKQRLGDRAAHTVVVKA